MVNDNEKILIKKAEFYYTMNLKCHIKIIGNSFKNGYICSGFIPDGEYFNFIDLRFPGITQRLFLAEIYDISDYREVGE